MVVVPRTVPSASRGAVDRRTLLGGALLGGLGLLTGCSPVTGGGPAGTATRTLRTAYGEVVVPADPARIACVGYYTPFQMQALGKRPVAVADYTPSRAALTADQRTFLEGLPTVGTVVTPEPERIAAARPDVILGEADYADEDLWRVLSGIAPTALFAPLDNGDWLTVAEQVAVAVGAGDALVETRARYAAGVEELRIRHAAALAGRRIAPITFGGTVGEFSVLHADNPYCSILTAFGVRLADFPSAPGDGSFTTIGIEALGRLGDATDILHPVRPDGGTFPAVDAVLTHPLFTRLPAARAGRVFPVVGYDVFDHATAGAAQREFAATVLGGR
ncbi:ABC transporter substrate-binding protein [Pseudonocardia sp. ICBG1122]|nr:ABC transporter substrate-binding protein [Pseudonocardia pini]